MIAVKSCPELEWAVAQAGKLRVAVLPLPPWAASLLSVIWTVQHKLSLQ